VTLYVPCYNELVLLRVFGNALSLVCTCKNRISRCEVASIFSTPEARAHECTDSAGNVSSSLLLYKGEQTMFHMKLYSFTSEALLHSCYCSRDGGSTGWSPHGALHILVKWVPTFRRNILAPSSGYEWAQKRCFKVILVGGHTDPLGMVGGDIDRSGPKKPENTNVRKSLLLTTRPEDGGSIFFRNVSIHLNYYSALQPKDTEQSLPRKH
jgi:hypothetical protein